MADEQITNCKTEGDPMHERFTDRARKVMQLANQEAQRANHDKIDTQHVLLALAKEGSGVAAHVLGDAIAPVPGCWEPSGSPAGSREWKTQKAVGLVRQKSEQLVPNGLGCGMTVAFEKLEHELETRDLIERSVAAARRLKHAYVGTEHLLLGIIAQPPETNANRVLAALGIKPVALESAVMALLGDEGGEPTKAAAVTFGEPVLKGLRDALTKARMDPTKGLPGQDTPFPQTVPGLDPRKWVAEAKTEEPDGGENVPSNDGEKDWPLGSPMLAGPPTHLHVVRGRHYTEESLRLAIDAAANLLVPGELRQPAAPGPEVRAAAEAFLTDLFGGPAESGK